MSIRLKILTPKGVYFDEEVDEAYFPSVNGPLGILPGYTRLLAEMKNEGILKILQNGESKYYAIFSGVLRVEKDGMTLMTQMIDEGDSIDLARAKASEARARERLEQHKEGLDVTRAQASLARALVRIEAKQLSSGGKKA